MANKYLLMKLSGREGRAMVLEYATASSSFPLPDGPFVMNSDDITDEAFYTCIYTTHDEEWLCEHGDPPYCSGDSDGGGLIPEQTMSIF